MKMIHRNALCSIALAVCLFLVGCASSQNNKVSEQVSAEKAKEEIPSYILKFDITCQENMSFSKYDLLATIDGQKLCEVRHGTEGISRVSMKEGKHTFTIQKIDDAKISWSSVFELTEDSFLSCDVKCKSSKLEVDNYSFTTQAEFDRQQEQESFHYSMEEPLEVNLDNISSIRDGDYVRITGYATLKSTRTGKINATEGGTGIGPFSKCGVELHLYRDDGATSIIEAYSVDPGGYEEVFATHPPADFSTEPHTVGDTSYSGCIMTIVGKIERTETTSEETGKDYSDIRFGDESFIESIEFFY